MSFKVILAVFPAATTFLDTAGVSAAPASDSAQPFVGDAIWYPPESRIGACGIPIQNIDLAIVLGPDEYAAGANCFRRVSVNYQGKWVDATVKDRCESCASGSIDLTSGTFQRLTSLDAGRIEVTWDLK